MAEGVANFSWTNNVPLENTETPSASPLYAMRCLRFHQHLRRPIRLHLFVIKQISSFGNLPTMFMKFIFGPPSQ